MPTPGPTTYLTLGQASVIASPIPPSVNQAWSVEVENISPWPLQVQIPGATNVFLAPGMGQLYTANSGPAQLTVTPVAVTGAPQSGNFYVLTNWAQAPDKIPGTFPVVVSPSLAGPTIIQPQEALIGQSQIPNSAVNTYDFSVTLPPWASTITVIVGDDGVNTSTDMRPLFVSVLNVTNIYSAVLGSAPTFAGQFGVSSPVPPPATPSIGGLSVPFRVFPAILNTALISINNGNSGVDFNTKWGGATVLVYANAETFTQNIAGTVQAVGSGNYQIVPGSSNNEMLADLLVVSYSAELYDAIGNPGGDKQFSVSVSTGGAILIPVAPAGYVNELVNDITLHGVTTATVGVFIGSSATPFVSADVTLPYSGAAATAGLRLPTAGVRTANQIGGICSSGSTTMTGAYRLVPFATIPTI